MWKGSVKGMGLKSIEMQVALPRTQDAGKVQEHTQLKDHPYLGKRIDYSG